MKYTVITNEQKSIHLNITAHLSGLAVEAVFLNPLTLFSLFVSLILLSLHVHKASVCACVWSAWFGASGHPRSQQSFSGRPFSPSKSIRDLFEQAISDLQVSQEKATDFLSEDGQSRWITTVSQMMRMKNWFFPLPPPPALCPQINPWTWNKETRSPSWSHSLWSQPSPSKSAGSRRPPPPPQ